VTARAVLPTPDPAKSLSTVNPELRKSVTVGDAEMAYIDIGEGDPIVFMHGNPTCSFLWRNVIPHVEGMGRIVAPDFIGHGWSSTSPRNAYRYPDNIDYFDAFFDALDIKRNAILVLHDWGAAVGFHRAARFPEHVQGIAYMEAMVRPRKWSDFSPERVKQFEWIRSPEADDALLEQNFFVEVMLFRRGIIRELSEAEKNVYRHATEQSGGTRLPGLVMPRDIPFDGEPADCCALIQSYSDWLVESDVPKLFVNADEGHGLAGAARDFARSLRNQTEITVHARHYLQEDAPDEIGAALARFVKRLRN